MAFVTPVKSPTVAVRGFNLSYPTNSSFRQSSNSKSLATKTRTKPSPPTVRSNSKRQQQSVLSPSSLTESSRDAANFNSAALFTNGGKNRGYVTPLSASRKVHSGSSSKADRFVPNRDIMAMDVAHLNLTERLEHLLRLECDRPESGDSEPPSPNRAGPNGGARSASQSPSVYQHHLTQGLFGLGRSCSESSPSLSYGFSGVSQNSNSRLHASRSFPSSTTSSPSVSSLSSDSHSVTRGCSILSFKDSPSVSRDSASSADASIFTSKVSHGSGTSGSHNGRKATRNIPQSAERILDAPELLDDYYLNLLDWCQTSNTVAVALRGSVYLWDPSTGNIEELPMQPTETAEQEDEDYVCSVNWAPDGKHLAVGMSNAEIQLWDAQRLCQVRKMTGHSARVSSLSWNGPVLSSGGKDRMIINHDVRVREHVISKLYGHTQEVCGLKWSPSGHQLASGGNDNTLFVWERTAALSSGAGAPRLNPTRSVARPTYLHNLQGHTAAVKALAWCPFQPNLLASGGGTADRTIRFWNTASGSCLNSVDTGSQVCSLLWSKHERELLSSHGYSENQLCLWKYPTMTKIAEFSGHTSRVLHMAQSPDGETVVSAAADETLRFWKAFGPNNLTSSASGVGVSRSGGAISASPLSSGVGRSSGQMTLKSIR